MSPVLRAFELLGRAIFSGQYLLYVPLAPVLLACGVKFNQKLQALVGMARGSPFHVRSNVVLLPIKLKWAWAPYALALAFVMPFLALLEEWIFRAGTTNWVRGLLIRDVGVRRLPHLFSFVSMRMVVYLTLVGALFVQVYLAAGIIAVFVLHATYNLTALGLTGRDHRKRRAAHPELGHLLGLAPRPTVP